MANDLFIGVPTDISDPETLEMFIVQLVTKLSAILGQDSSVTLNSITSRIAALEQVNTTVRAIPLVQDASATYDQAEMQTVIDTLNTLIRSF